MRKYHINFLDLLNKGKKITAERLRKIIVRVNYKGEKVEIGKYLFENYRKEFENESA